MSSLNFPQLKLPSLGRTKFWRKNKHTVTISDLDPSFRVTYLGNVLTGWAKGEGCVDKPLATLWRNHVTSDKPQILMKVTITTSGLKAITKEHGLTEYWAPRITYCKADCNYPKVFCWIYKHEGRKMKQELRCHAVLCSSETKARTMATKLQERLHQALIDFKKEKMSRQNARLSLANTIYENPSMPNRKILLHTGSSNYRPAIDRGKSVTKLRVIEEVILEEDEEYYSDELNDVEATSIRMLESQEYISQGSCDRTILCRSSSAPGGCGSLKDQDEEEDDDEDTNVSYDHEINTEMMSLATCNVSRVIEDEVFSLQPMHKEDNVLSMALSRKDDLFKSKLITSFHEDLEDDHEEEEEDADVVTNYMSIIPTATITTTTRAGTIQGPLRRIKDDILEIDSAVSVPPDNNAFSTLPGIRDKMIDDNDDDDLLNCEASLKKHIVIRKLTKQDALPGESGYSEASTTRSAKNNLSNSTPIDIINKATAINNTRSKDKLSGNPTLTTMDSNELDKAHQDEAVPNAGEMIQCDQTFSASEQRSEEDELCDLTVHSAMITDMTSLERQRYLDKRTLGHVSPNKTEFLQNNRLAEFCINI